MNCLFQNKYSFCKMFTPNKCSLLTMRQHNFFGINHNFFCNLKKYNYENFMFHKSKPKSCFKCSFSCFLCTYYFIDEICVDASFTSFQLSPLSPSSHPASIFLSLTQ